MRIWEKEYKKRREARPVDFKEDPSDWSGFETIIEDRNGMLKMLWDSRVPGSRAPESFYQEMVQAWYNRGYDVSEAEKLLDEGFKALQQEDYRYLEIVSARVREALRNAPVDPDHPYWKFNNPTDWLEIKKAFRVKNEEYKFELNQDLIKKKIESGWSGQIAGGAYGTALEGYTGDVLRETYGDKLNFYVKEPETYNDDITFQLAFLKALEEKGKKLGASDIADKWLELIPFGWSAEYIALENLRKGIYPPESGSFDNFFSEWIGAQMRGMVCGFVAPGKPLQAAHYAYMDGIVSHEKNGVYGEIHCAVLTSLAFIYNDTRSLLKESRKFIPEGSQFAYFFDKAMDRAKNNQDHLSAWKSLEEELKTYNWIHTYPNMVAVVLSLWYSDNSFDKAMRILADCGMDVDCNAGEVGSILGVMNPESIGDKWIKPFNNRLKTYVPGYEEMKISELSDWTFKLVNI